MHDTRQEPLFDDDFLSTSRGLPTEQQDVWAQLLAVIFRLPTALEAGLRSGSDLSLTEFIVMSLLADAPNKSQRMTTLARAAHLSGPRATQLMSRLEKRGLVERRTGDADGRAIVATLTADGLALLEEASPAFTKDVQARVFNRLTAEQIAQLRDISAAMDTAVR